MSGKKLHLFSRGSVPINKPRTERKRRGITFIWAVLVMILIIAFVGLTLDTGLGYLVGHQLQNAADASSLAAAQKLGEEIEVIQEAARAIAAENYASSEAVLLALNLGNAPGGDIVIGTYNREERTFTPDVDNPNAVKVVARRTEGSLGGALPLIFGPIFGVDTINVERDAIAMLGGSTGSGLIVLDEGGSPTFRLSGNVNLNVTDSTSSDGIGAIQINSDHSGALKTDGNPTLVASDINVHADSVSDPPEFDGDLNEGSSRIDDPLAELPPPDVTSPVITGTSYNGGQHNLSPGYYPEGISMTGGTVNLAPGVYVLDGAGLNVTGGDLIGDGVMLYITDDSPGNPRTEIKLTGNGTIDITPAPLGSGIYGGILLWQDADKIGRAHV